MNKTIRTGTRTGSIQIPSSKSIVHRLLICAALGDQQAEIQYSGMSKDIWATICCLSALGAGISHTDRQIKVEPIDVRREQSEEIILPVGESGSTLRFMLPLAGALGRKAVYLMEGRLSARPLSPFDRLLEEKGMKIRRNGDRLYSEGKLQSGSYVLPGNISSQYFSGLLMGLPILEGSSVMKSEGKLESAGYVRLTEDILQAAHIYMERPDDVSWRIPGGQKTRMQTPVISEGDWSNAAFFLCMGALSEKGICVSGLNLNSGQGDREVLQILKEFGARISFEEEAVSVSLGEKHPLVIDASDIPDLVPVVSVLCCAAKGRSEITHAARLRLKESDRLRSVSELIRSLGGEITEHPSGLTIFGSGTLQGGTIDSSNDHRIAMSAAVAASLCETPVTVLGSECVEKSYPAFFDDMSSLTIN